MGEGECCSPPKPSGCCGLRWLRGLVGRVVGKHEPEEGGQLPIQVVFGDPADLSPDFGDEDEEEEESSDEEEEESEEVMVKPLVRQVSPLPSLQCSGGTSAGRQLAHRCLQCGRPAVEARPLVTCGACRMAEYCGAACQARHRPRHRAACGRLLRLLRRLDLGPLGRRPLRRVFLDEGSYEVCEEAAAAEVEEVCGRYIEPVVAAYWEEGWREGAARPVQEAAAWLGRMARARVQAAEWGGGRGLLDALVGGRTAGTAAPAVDVRWASIWSISGEVAAGGGRGEAREGRGVTLATCLMALGKVEEAATLLHHWLEPSLVGAVWRGELLAHLAAWHLLPPSPALPPPPSSSCFTFPASEVTVLWELVVLRLEGVRGREERWEEAGRGLATLLLATLPSAGECSAARRLAGQRRPIAAIAGYLGCAAPPREEAEWREVRRLVERVRRVEETVGRNGKAGSMGEVEKVLASLPSHLTTRLWQMVEEVEGEMD